MIQTNECLRSKLNKVFIEWCSNTTAHGIPNFVILKKNRYLRFIWFLFFIVSLASCIYVITKSLIEYYEYKVSVSIDDCRDRPSVFPTVTICNMNGIKSEYIQKYIEQSPSRVRGSLSNCLHNSLDDCIQNDYVEMRNEFVKSLDTISQQDNNRHNNRSSYSLNLKEHMLISCSFNKLPCTYTNFSEHWINDYGNCYTFNEARSYVPGPNFGLEVSLVLQRPDYESLSEVQPGVYIMIENRTSYYKLDFNAAAGMVTNLGIKRTYKKKLGTPYSDCIHKLTPFSPYSEKIFDYFKPIMNRTTYAQDICYKLCFEDRLIETCGCATLKKMAKHRNVPSCDSTDARHMCAEVFTREFYTDSMNDRCESVCEDACDSFVYHINRNEFVFKDYSYLRQLSNSRQFEKKLPRGLTKATVAAYAQKNFARLRIYYEELMYTLIEDNPKKTFIELLGDIGGQLGLFIGISLLSFIEIIELFSVLLLTCANYYTRKKDTN